jgi:hypothetical protein
LAQNLVLAHFRVTTLVGAPVAIAVVALLLERHSTRLMAAV